MLCQTFFRRTFPQTHIYILQSAIHIYAQMKMLSERYFFYLQRNFEVKC